MSKEIYWWLSFADPDRPEGEQFLGVCIVLAPDFLTAVAESRRMGINPGGEVQGYPYSIEEDDSAAYHANILMSKNELLERRLIRRA